MNEETKEMVDIVYGDPRLSKFRQEQRKARRERFTYGSQHLAKDKEIDAASSKTKRFKRGEVPFDETLVKPEVTKSIRRGAANKNIEASELSKEVTDKYNIDYNAPVQKEHGKGLAGDKRDFSEKKTPLDLITKDPDTGQNVKIRPRGSDSPKTQFSGSGAYNIRIQNNDSFSIRQIRNLFKPSNWLEAVIDQEAFGDDDVINLTNEDWLRLQQGDITDGELIAHKFRVQDEAMKGNIWLDAASDDELIFDIHSADRRFSKQKHYNEDIVESGTLTARTEKSKVKPDAKDYNLTKLASNLGTQAKRVTKADLVAQLGLNVTTGNITGAFINAGALSAHLVGQTPKAQKVLAELTIKIANSSDVVKERMLKELTKAVGERAGKTALKAIPGVDVTMSAVEAWGYIQQGKLDQAGIAALSGAIGWVPVAGDLAAAMLDITNTAIDISRADFNKKGDADADKQPEIVENKSATQRELDAWGREVKTDKSLSRVRRTVTSAVKSLN